MKHIDCANFLNLDCEKGMCALSKIMVPIDGPGSDACPRFKPQKFCKNCSHFENPDKHGIGTCTGYEQPDWTYASMGGFSCPKHCFAEK